MILLVPTLGERGHAMSTILPLNLGHFKSVRLKHVVHKTICGAEHTQPKTVPVVPAQEADEPGRLLILTPDIHEAILLLLQTLRRRDPVILHYLQPMASLPDWG